MAEDIENVLRVSLPRHKLIKVERDGEKLELCSALLGAYSTQGVGICRHTRQYKYRSVLERCHRLAKLRTGILSCPYTSIALNQGAYGEHTDNNYGDTVVLALGSYTGGELRVGDHVVKSRLCWVRFNGNVPHEVLPYKGHRRSISLFVTRRWHLLTPQHASQLQGLGFDCARLFCSPLVSVADVGEGEKGTGRVSEGRSRPVGAGSDLPRRARAPRATVVDNFDALILGLSEGSGLHFMTFFRVGVRHIKLLDRSDPVAEETIGTCLPDTENILPCGLPYKSIYWKGCTLRSGRRSAMRREKFVRRAHWINQAVAYLSWLAMRRPRGYVYSAVLAWKLTSRQRELCASLWS
eukprot:6488398-Amphidinium_carterae.2